MWHVSSGGICTRCLWKIYALDFLFSFRKVTVGLELVHTSALVLPFEQSQIQHCGSIKKTQAWQSTWIDMDEADEVYLYDPALLSRVNLTKSRCNFNPAVLSAIDPTPGIRLRPLSSKDYDRGKLRSLHWSLLFCSFCDLQFSTNCLLLILPGFLEILGQLTTVGDISKRKFQGK